MILRTTLLSLLLCTLLPACVAEEEDSSADVGVQADQGPRENYPSGGYGVEEGAILEDHSFTEAMGEPLSLADIYGQEGNQILLISTSAGWCTACREEQSNLKSLYTDYHERGLEILLTVFEDSDFNPATVENARAWKTQYDLRFPVIADTENYFSKFYPPDSTPMNMLVEVEGMKIISIKTGWDESLTRAILDAKL